MQVYTCENNIIYMAINNFLIVKKTENQHNRVKEKSFLGPARRLLSSLCFKSMSAVYVSVTKY